MRSRLRRVARRRLQYFEGLQLPVRHFCGEGKAASTFVNSAVELAGFSGVAGDHPDVLGGQDGRVAGVGAELELGSSIRADVCAYRCTEARGCHHSRVVAAESGTEGLAHQRVDALGSVRRGIERGVGREHCGLRLRGSCVASGCEELNVLVAGNAVVPGCGHVGILRHGRGWARRGVGIIVHDWRNEIKSVRTKIRITYAKYAANES